MVLTEANIAPGMFIVLGCKESDGGVDKRDRRQGASRSVLEERI
jgi:hypothetical protein